jgi:RNA polymerase sigma-70 factor (ECF subfamily)
MDYLRHEKRIPKITFPDGTDLFSVLEFEESPVIDEIHLERTGNKAKEMLLQLSHEQREVITLRIFGNLSFNEIAKITDVSVNTALGRMRYGLINLRKAMLEKGVVL